MTMNRPTPSGDRVVYAYAIALDTAGLDEAVAALTGVAAAPVRLVHDRVDPDLTAAVSSVPQADFDEDALKRHLEDLDWLEVTARSHHGVIEALAARTTVLPLRLATIYLADEGVVDALDRGRAVFLDGLSRLSDHVEWGVKVYVQPKSAAGPAPAPERASRSPGRAYLKGRRAQREGREQFYALAARAAEKIEEAGRRYASDRARHGVQQGQLAVRPGENVVNDAYLVSLAASEDFRTAAAGAAQGLAGVQVEVTGPWAPYSFAPRSLADPGESGDASAGDQRSAGS
ncbi:GvpL/GvpF family gas vesicle protein [Streptomyces sp. NPDC058001]|uniref:GvpL/GvpF family gas vesicle protein n=1 Tax=Streptomyces sp. NPDC058001 TaxID=3346300 RepID=UPI0036E0C454